VPAADLAQGARSRHSRRGFLHSGRVGDSVWAAGGCLYGKLRVQSQQVVLLRGESRHCSRRRAKPPHLAAVSLSREAVTLIHLQNSRRFGAPGAGIDSGSGFSGGG
jgi:hypothetical protein